MALLYQYRSRPIEVQAVEDVAGSFRTGTPRAKRSWSAHLEESSDDVSLPGA